MGDLVLTRCPQTPKGQTPFAGPFKVVKVVGRYSCILSDGQKWNTCLLKCYTPHTTWTDILASPPLLTKGVLEPQGHEGGGESGSDGEDQVIQERTVHTPHKHPDRERRPPDRFSPEDYRRDIVPKKRGKK